MSCRDDNCYDNECGYIDVIHHSSRCRHYENGNVTLTWHHHPLRDGVSNLPFSGGNGRVTNFAEFTGHGQPGLEDVNGLQWEVVAWCIGQHPIGWMDELLEDLNIELTPEEDALLNNCDMLLYYVSDQIWRHNIVPFERPSPTVTCVLADAGKGTLVRVLWSQPLYSPNYEWNRSMTATSCDAEVFDVRECIWRSTRDGYHLGDYIDVPGIINFGRVYPLWTTKPTRDRVVLIGPPGGKCTFDLEGNLLDEAPVAFGHVVQVRDTKTGDLLFDGAVESEYATKHFVFEGAETTCGSDDPWCDPHIAEQEPEVIIEGYVPTSLHWACAFDDTALIGCMSVAGNRDDIEAWEETTGEEVTLLHLFAAYGGVRLVTLHQSEDNPHMLTEQSRSPLGFVPYGGLPAFSPEGELWVSGFMHTWELPKDDPDYSIEYGVWRVGMASVTDPVKEEKFNDHIGNLSIWCDELYALTSGGVKRYDPETDTADEPFYTKRTPRYGGETDDLSAQFSFGIGYYGWEFGFYSDGFFDWGSNFWSHQGWAYAGWRWGESFSCSMSGICQGPVTWQQYVVADWTEGGDLDKIKTFFSPTEGRVVTNNPCRDLCHDDDLEEDDDGCGGCDCDNVELEVVFGEPDCYGMLPITVNCLGCGSRNYPSPNRHTFLWRTNGLAWVEGCECVEELTVPLWNEGICGTTFFVQLGEISAISIIYSRCGCAWGCCYPLPTWECPITIDGPIEFSELPSELPAGCSGLVEECYDITCRTSASSIRWYKFEITVDCEDPPEPTASVDVLEAGYGKASLCGPGGPHLIQTSDTTWDLWVCASFAGGNSVVCGGETDPGPHYAGLQIGVSLPGICSASITYVPYGSLP